jgi:2-haloacid dehalogenase
VARDAFVDMSSGTPPRGLLCDLLMAVMNSLEIWSAAAKGRERGLRWRDTVTARMIAEREYTPYEDLVAAAAAALELPPGAPADLFRRWHEMQPWPDAGHLSGVAVPFAFVSNCSAELARVAAHRSGLSPAFVLSAEEAGWFKPDPRIYRAACDRLGTSAGETLFVAGSPYDGAGAAKAGLQAVLVGRRDDLESRSVPTAASFEEVVLHLRGAH